MAVATIQLNSDPGIGEDQGPEKFHWSSLPRKYSNLTGRAMAPGNFYSLNRVRECTTHVTTILDLDAGKHECARDWCQAHFGDNWTYNFGDFYFKNPQDALLFALRWAGDAG